MYCLKCFFSIINFNLLIRIELMKKYCLDTNKNDDGYYLVHTETCQQLQSAGSQVNLGFHDIATTAIVQAKKLYSEASEIIKGCKDCINNYLLEEK